MKIVAERFSCSQLPKGPPICSNSSCALVVPTLRKFGSFSSDNYTFPIRVLKHPTSDMKSTMPVIGNKK